MADAFKLLRTGTRFQPSHTARLRSPSSSSTSSISTTTVAVSPSSNGHNDFLHLQTPQKQQQEQHLTEESIQNLPFDPPQSLQTNEQISAFRRKNGLHVSSNQPPTPISSFSELPIADNIMSTLLDQGITAPTPVQMQCIPIILEGRDLLGCAPTGSGKTLAYLLPILHLLKKPRKKGFRAVIVVPTRELAQQIFREAQQLSRNAGFRLCCLTKPGMSSTTISENKFDVLITTPLRLVNLVNEEAVNLSTVEHLVLDEGDRLLELGFLEQVDSIIAACTHPESRRYLLSATLPEGIEILARSVTKDPVRVIIGQRNTTTSTVDQKLKYVGSEQGKLLALHQVIQEGVKPPVIIFVQSVERAKELHHELMYDGLNMDVIHSDRPQEQRDQVIKNFRLGKIWFLICTDLLSRGIDFKGVELVINYDFPQTTVSYIHRVGRAGRGGLTGQAITFFTNEDAGFLRSIANVMKESGCEIPEWMLQLKKASKRKRKYLESHPPKRDHISTRAKYDIEHIHHKRQIVEESKKQKQNKRQKLDSSE